MEYKIKRFSKQRDPLPIRFVDLPQFREIERKVWTIEYSPKVNKQLSGLPSFTRKRIRELKKSLEESYVYIDNPNVENENTHYLSKFSSTGKYHRLSKNINGHDRFDYIVYPPTIHENKDGVRFLLSKIVVQSVLGHFDWRKERPYSDTNKE